MCVGGRTPGHTYYTALFLHPWVLSFSVRKFKYICTTSVTTIAVSHSGE